MKSFSFKRTFSIVLKEFIQMKRDRITLAMMFGIPIIQLIIFGYAINSNPKHLKTAIINGDYYSTFTRRYISSLKNSEYFDIVKETGSRADAEKMLLSNDTTFIITIPQGFYHKLIKGENPKILIEADSVDQSTVGTALSVAQDTFNRLCDDYFTGPLSYLRGDAAKVTLNVHKLYNPDEVMQFSTVPSLIGVILTLTLVFISSLSMTKETERGTMENLLCMPVRPLEVLVGKMGPYMIMGFIQMILTIIASMYLFSIPLYGNIFILLLTGWIFIVATLGVGILFSTVAKNQLQAVQMSMFFFLPSMMLSGFMFSFQAMPFWARCIGYCLPLTHFNVIIRNIMLKGAGFLDIQFRVYYILIFLVVVLTAGVVRYRQTLD